MSKKRMRYITSNTEQKQNRNKESEIVSTGLNQNSSQPFYPHDNFIFYPLHLFTCIFFPFLKIFLIQYIMFIYQRLHQEYLYFWISYVFYTWKRPSSTLSYPSAALSAEKTRGPAIFRFFKVRSVFKHHLSE